MSLLLHSVAIAWLKCSVQCHYRCIVLPLLGSDAVFNVTTVAWRCHCLAQMHSANGYGALCQAQWIDLEEFPPFSIVEDAIVRGSLGRLCKNSQVLISFSSNPFLLSGLLECFNCGFKQMNNLELSSFSHPSI